jgi:hypothetical protein
MIGWLLFGAFAVWVLVLEWRVSRLLRASKHHEHVIRLLADSVDNPPARFARMVLDEEAWDPRDRLVNRRSAKATDPR